MLCQGEKAGGARGSTAMGSMWPPSLQPGVALALCLQLSSSLWFPCLGGGDLLAPHLCHAGEEGRREGGGDLVAGDRGLTKNCKELEPEAWEVGTDSGCVSSAPQQRGRAGDVGG
jgi:hypothetical protein